MEAIENQGPTHIHLRTAHTSLEEHQWDCLAGKNTKWGEETQEESHSSTVLCLARRCSCTDPGEPKEANTGQIKQKKRLVYFSHNINTHTILNHFSLLLFNKTFPGTFGSTPPPYGLPRPGALGPSPLFPHRQTGGV